MSNISTEIMQMRENLLSIINPTILQEKQLMTSDNWFCSNPEINIQAQENEIVFVNASDQSNYVSLIEKNTYFNSLPKQKLEVYPNEKIKCEMNFDIVGKLTVHIAIIEYSHLKKLKSTLYSCKSSFVHKMSDQTYSVRIAVKISGKGIASLKNGTINRYTDLEDKPTISYQSQPIKKKNKKITHLKQLNVAAIFDEFTTSCYKEEVSLITFTPADFEKVLDENKPDFLFVESAWKGNQGSWEYKIGKYANEDGSELANLLDWCKKRAIPTIFWNKEDPIHFDKFIDAAKKFDYIYTTDSNLIETYKERCKHDQVYALPFSAQPQFHNPIDIREGRKNKVSFAGSYYANRHIDRKNDMEEVLDVASSLGLDIYDRNFEKSQQGITDFSFPERFRTNVKGSLAYSEIALAYKGYNFIANVNSIKYSPTMFSRRVFEGLASGTPIISSYSEGIKKMFGDIVIIGDKDESLKEKFAKIIEDKESYKRKKLQGIREVMLNHTYSNRLQFILKNLNIKFDLAEDVTIIAEADTTEELEEIRSIYNNQMYSNKKLLILSTINPKNIDFLELNKQKNIEVIIKTKVNACKKMTQLIKTKYFIFMDSRHFYGKHFIEDLIAGSIYSKADIVTKNNYYEYEEYKILEVGEGQEFSYSNQGNWSCSLVRTNYSTTDNAIEFINRMKEEASLDYEFRSGKRIFSIDNANFIKNGRILLAKDQQRFDI
ncbi:hypothetical protein IGI43_001876 [Enterococcus sp. AZ126]